MKDKVLITAGPTFEPIDAVRFIGNYSSGKMGYALAEIMAARGAEVLLISGPVAISVEHPLITRINVNTADEMFHQCMKFFPECSVAILAAAVADFTPAHTFNYKVKRGKENWNMELQPTRDIAQALGRIKKRSQLLAGFALETDNEEQNAREKLRKKNLDLIVLNSLKDQGAGFRTDTNKISIIDKNNNIDKFELKSKKEVARDIADKIYRMKDSLSDTRNPGEN